MSDVSQNGSEPNKLALNNCDLGNFDECANVFVIYGALLSPAELHGLITGVLVTGKRLTNAQWLEVIYNQMGIDAMEDTAHKQYLHTLHQLPLAQLTGGEFSFTLLLPDDDTELSQRLASIGVWCGGFLSGFGLGQTHTSVGGELKDDIVNQDQVLTSSSHNTLSTFVEIAQISHEANAETSVQQEQNEQDYMMLVEYIRLAVMDMFEQYHHSDLAQQHTVLAKQNNAKKMLPS